MKCFLIINKGWIVKVKRVPKYQRKIIEKKGTKKTGSKPAFNLNFIDELFQILNQL